MSDLPRGTLIAVALAAGLASCGGHGPEVKAGTTATAPGRNGSPTGSTHPASGGSAHGSPSGTFKGRIVDATGRLAGDRNSVVLHLRTAGSSGTRRLNVSRRLIVTLSSSQCASRQHCLPLAGQLSGSLVQRPGVADRGRTFVISASGAVNPLGQAVATGTVTGTGNTRFGHESLSLTVSGRSEKVVLAVQSAPVAGFTSP